MKIGKCLIPLSTSLILIGCDGFSSSDNAVVTLEPPDDSVEIKPVPVADTSDKAPSVSTPTPAPKKLTEGSNVAASSNGAVATATYNSETAANINDGRDSTTWTSSPESPLIIKFGAIENIGYIKIKRVASSVTAGTNPDILVELSEDGRSYRPSRITKFGGNVVPCSGSNIIGRVLECGMDGYSAQYIKITSKNGKSFEFEEVIVNSFKGTPEPTSEPKTVPTVDDYSDTTTSSGRLSTSSSVNGNIETSGDTDWFRVSLTGGATYQIDLEGSPTGEGTLYDPYLRGIYTSSGTLIRQTSNDDGGTGRNSQLDFTPTSNGNYFISTGGLSSHTGTYQLSIDGGSGGTTSTVDDYSSNTGTSSGRLSTSRSVNGNIETSGDTDWFRVSLTGGTTYQIDLEGSPTGEGTLYDPYLRGIYTSSGTLIRQTSNYDGGTGRNSQLDFTPTSNGNYFISAGAPRSYTGTYQLSIDGGSGGTTSTVDDYSSNTGASSGRLSTSSSVNGNIETPDDTDWFRVSLTGGTTYQIDLEGSPTGEGTLYDPYLRGIYTSSGTLIRWTSNDDGGTGRNSQLDFTPTSNGNYFISTGGLSSYTGTYQLSIHGGSVPVVPEVRENGINTVSDIKNPGEYNLIISGIGNNFTIKSGNQIKELDVSGIDNTVTIENGVTVGSFSMSGIDNTVYVPSGSSISASISGIGNVLQKAR